MDGQTDGWTDEWYMYEWIHMHGYLYEWMHVRIDRRWTEGRMASWLNGWMEQTRVDGWMKE